jgi:ubiquinone/menaquinone biosynthesis C-methylase UbiE
MATAHTPIPGNEEAIEAWDGVLFDRFVEFRDVLVAGLGAHGDEALRIHPVEPGQRVLDVGCGFGDTTQQIAALAGPEGEAVGIDASARFIEAARGEAEEAGATNVSFLVGDVQAFEFEEAGFDRAFSRMGTMFFANPVAAMRNVRRALRPGGLLTMVVWRQKPDNEWLYRAEQVVEQFVEEPEESDEPTCGPGPFSMANADTTSGILLSAGFEDISLRRSDIPFRAGNDLQRAVDGVMAIGPAGEVIRLAGAEAERIRPRIEAALREALSVFQQPDGSVVANSSTWIVSARA